MYDRYLRTKQVREKYNLRRQTLYEWQEKGLLNPAQTPGGHYRYSEREIRSVLDLDLSENIEGVAIYGRVSTKKQKDNLDRQRRRLREWAKRRDYEIVMVETDIASGLNDDRSGLNKLMKEAMDRSFDTLLIEYEDRLTRFGYKYLERYFRSHGVEIITKEEREDKTDEEELVEDILKIVTVFSARLYGKRGGKKVRKKTKEGIEECQE